MLFGVCRERRGLPLLSCRPATIRFGWEERSGTESSLANEGQRPSVYGWPAGAEFSPPPGHLKPIRVLPHRGCPGGDRSSRIADTGTLLHTRREAAVCLRRRW